MEPKLFDARGLKCPLPSMKMMNMGREMKPGEILEVIADCPTFEADVRKYCEVMKKALLFVKVEGNAKRVQVRM
jgi:tRNA 2-thiouridine synthesizing protein A